MELKKDKIYTMIKHNTTLLNFILYYIVKAVIEGLDSLKAWLLSLFPEKQVRTNYAN